MSADRQSLVPQPVPALEGSTPYTVPRHPAPIDLRLDSNEGAPPPQELLKGLFEELPELARSYPKKQSLEALIASRLGADPEQVVVSAGADQSLEAVCKAYLGPGREMILPLPTFEMISRYAALSGATVKHVAWEEPSYPLDAVLSQITPRTAVIAVVTPNSPTGTVASSQAIAALSKAAPHAIILVDLAYIEFADEDPTPELLRLPNVIGVRTLSKAWGLAGLRVGFSFGPAALMLPVRTAVGPYPTSGVSLAAAERLLRDGERPMQQFVTAVRREREQLETLIPGLGGRLVPSQGNFVLGRFGNAAWIWEGLASLGIAVRRFGAPDLAEALRITCPGDERAMTRLVHALQTIVSPEALIFDLDGVLADVSRSYRQAIIAAAASFGVAVMPEAITAEKAKGGANNDWELTHRLVARDGVDCSLEEVTARFEELYQGGEGTPGLHLQESLIGERETLERLSRRLPLGIVTGRPRKDAERFLETHRLQQWFSAVVCMEDAPLKPRPDPVLRCLELLGVSRAWMIGDTPDDACAARAAGVVPLGIISPSESPGFAEILRSAGAARVVTTINELEELL